VELTGELRAATSYSSHSPLSGQYAAKVLEARIQNPTATAPVDGPGDFAHELVDLSLRGLKTSKFLKL
jgi:hypothetical protein